MWPLYNLMHTRAQHWEIPGFYWSEWGWWFLLDWCSISFCIVIISFAHSCAHSGLKYLLYLFWSMWFCCNVLVKVCEVAMTTRAGVDSQAQVYSGCHWGSADRRFWSVGSHSFSNMQGVHPHFIDFLWKTFNSCYISHCQVFMAFLVPLGKFGLQCVTSLWMHRTRQSNDSA